MYVVEKIHNDYGTPMKLLNLSLFALIGSMLINASAHAGSKWVRLTWQGDASTEATISFTPDGTNNNPYVSYGNTTNEGNWSTESVAFTTSMVSITSKHVRLTNLTADSEVYFRVCDDTGCGDHFWFKTAPNDNSPFVYVAGGDTRSGWTNRQDGNVLISKIRPLFVMHGGDYTNANNNSEWSQYLVDWELTYSNDTINSIAYKRIYPLVSTHGNHEDDDINTICKMFGVDANQSNSCSAYDTYYSVDVSPLLRVYTLNSQFMNQSSTLQNAQNTWLTNDLSNNGGNVKWRTAQYHKPMFPHYSGKSDNQTLFNWWAQDFYDYGMNLVVESDTHLTKLTEVVAPSGSTYAGADQGVTAGTVYVGEGSWGAPARSANDPKAWTVDLASIQQFKVITVSDTQMEVRTAQFNGSPSTITLAQRASNPTLLPSNVNWWNANGVGEVMTLETDNDNRSILAGTSGGGSGMTETISAQADTFISSSQSSTNFNGSTEQLLADGEDSTYGEMQTLIQWDTSSFSTCATVEVVKVELNVFNLSSGTYNLYAGLNTWDENSATWNSVSGNGHQGDVLGSFTPGSTGLYSIQLNAAGVAAVQSWVQGSANNGIVIASSATDGIDINDRESGNAPKLVITYNEDQCSGGNQAPSANFSASDSNLTVNYTDTSSDSDGSITSWSWNFGDGNTATSQNPQHTYSTSGTYSVSLTVTDNDGATDTHNANVTVSGGVQSVSFTTVASDDTFISSNQASNNFDGINDELLADGSDRTYGVINALLKWDTSSIASCATVESVSFTMNVFDRSPGAYNIFAGQNSWDETTATWNSVSGSSHQGSQVGSVTPSSTGQYTINLNAAGVTAVQGWISGSTNNGLVIASGGTSNGVDFHDQESGSGSEMTIVYNESQCN